MVAPTRGRPRKQQGEGGVKQELYQEPTIRSVKTRKRQLEIDIRSSVNTLVEQFKKETGVFPTWIQIGMEEHTSTGMTRREVGRVIVEITL